MTIKIGINGFGRIGRMVLRAAVQNFRHRDRRHQRPAGARLPGLHAEVRQRARPLQGEVSVEGNTLVVNGKKIRLTQERDPANLKWNEVGADVVIESTGLFLTRKAPRSTSTPAPRRSSCRPLQGRHAHVRVRREPRDLRRPGHHLQRLVHHQLPGPVAKVLNDKWGIKRGLMTTVHAATATQKTVDGPSNKDWRGGRGILENIIPSSTGAAKAVGVVIPELNKKLTGMSFRVPTSDVSVVDLTVELKRKPPTTRSAPR
jgi:glyceraldehyde 3-phosphate dehydrogenase